MIELSLITTGADNHYFTENNISIKALKPFEEGEWDGYLFCLIGGKYALCSSYTTEMKQGWSLEESMSLILLLSH
jgi:hypothetical protein